MEENAKVQKKRGKHPGGRPVMYPQGDRQVHVTVPVEQYAAMARYSAESGLSMQAIIRQALRKLC